VGLKKGRVERDRGKEWEDKGWKNRKEEGE
jgi:hypothetical protein